MASACRKTKRGRRRIRPDLDGEGRFEIYLGDCMQHMRSIADNTIDSILTDPPYGLGFTAWDSVPPGPDFFSECRRVLKPGGHIIAAGSGRTYHRLAEAAEEAGLEIRAMLVWIFSTGFPKGPKLYRDDSLYSTTLKPAHEPLLLARKPLEGGLRENFKQHGTGALHIDAARIDVQSPGVQDPAGYIELPDGRWPADVCHDGSDAVLAGFPESNRGGKARAGSGRPYTGLGSTSSFRGPRPRYFDYGDPGSAARFFYCAKPRRKERTAGLSEFGIEANEHPTVKPVSLFRHYARLITPPDGIILDPFLGSGSTACAAALEGFRFVGIEAEESYVRVACARSHAALGAARASLEHDVRQPLLFCGDGASV